MKSKKLFSLLLVLLMIGSVLPGCASSSNTSATAAATSAAAPEAPAQEIEQAAPSLAPTEETDQEDPETRTVVDSKGNEATLPYKVERVATSGALNQMVLILGQPQKIAATAEGVQKSFFATVYPGILDVPAAYTGAGPGTLNMETLVAAKPQAMFGAPEDMKATLEAAGIASLEVGLVTPEDIKRTLGIVAQVLGEGAEENAAAFNEYYDRNLAFVSEGTKDAEKVRVFVAGSDGSAGGISSIGRNDIHTSYIEAAGGLNIVAEDAELSAEAAPSVDFEYLMKAQPDVVIVSAKNAYDSILAPGEENLWRKLDAVATGKVYLVPKGVYLWNVRSCEGALQPLFLASVLHPDLFPDLDVKQEAKDFYERFYHYELTDAEVEDIFSQNT